MAINHYRSRDGAVIQTRSGSGLDAQIRASATWTVIDAADIEDGIEDEVEAVVEDDIDGAEVVEEPEPVKAPTKKEAPVPLASNQDVEVRLGRPLTTTETTRSNGLVAEASVLVRGYLGQAPDRNDLDAMEAIAVVCSRMVARVLTREATMGELASVESATTQFGPFGETLTFGRQTYDVILTAADKDILKPYRVAGGFTSIGISTGRTGRYRSLV